MQEVLVNFGFDINHFQGRGEGEDDEIKNRNIDSLSPGNSLSTNCTGIVKNYTTLQNLQQTSPNEQHFAEKTISQRIRELRRDARYKHTPSSDDSD